MKKLILTTNKTINHKQITKGDNIMKKLILTASLMVSAVFASFGAVQVNDHGIINVFEHSTSFTFTSDGSYGIAFGNNFALGPMLAFGYYYTSGPNAGVLQTGTFTGNTSNYFSSNGWGTDYNTAYLGDFKAGDTIGIWIAVANSTGTFTSTEIGAGYAGLGSASLSTFFGFGAPGYRFQFIDGVTNPNPVGEPLPGVMAALALGGAAFIGRKLKNRVKK